MKDYSSGSTQETETLAKLIRVFAGILIIFFSQTIIFGSAFFTAWIDVAILGRSLEELQILTLTDILIFVPLIVCLFSVLLVVVFWLSPATINDVNSGFRHAAGVLLLVYPIVPVGSRIFYDSPGFSLLGFETSYWYIFSLLGLLFLILPKIQESNRLKEFKILVPITVFFLGLITILLSINTFIEISAIGLSITPYSFLFIASGIIVMIWVVLQVFLPNEFGVKPDL